jgi:hypothetical protein
MILHAYGDSWTEGEGCDLEIESTLKNQELIIYRNQNSWVKLLANKIGIDCKNNGVSGNSNNNIFNKIVLDIILYDDKLILLWLT